MKFLCASVFCLLSVTRFSDAAVMQRPVKPTCIIGAGYAGLATARYLKEYDMPFVVLEATRHAGGNWRFDPHIGMDEDGLPMMTNQYKYLRTNTPRQTMEFFDFPAPDDTPSYPTGTCFYKYILSFVRKFQLEKNIRFGSLVSSVKRTGDHWTVTFVDTATRTENSETCDNVVVATGSYQALRWPRFPGEEDFKGKIIHSHDYRDPEVFAGRRVLLVGAGPSGLDLATHLSNRTAKLVHSHHLTYNQPHFSETYVKKPDVERLLENGVLFKDGSFEEVDDVIYATGFEFNHDILDASCGVTHNSKFLLPLYQHIVNIRHPTMFFVGIAKGISTVLLDVQAAYTASWIADRFERPRAAAMLRRWLEEAAQLRPRRRTISDVLLVGDRQDQYFANLTAEAGVPRVPPVITTIRDYNLKIRLDDILHYRDYNFNILDNEHYERYLSPTPGEYCPVEE